MVYVLIKSYNLRKGSDHILNSLTLNLNNEKINNNNS